MAKLNIEQARKILESVPTTLPDIASIRRLMDGFDLLEDVLSGSCTIEEKSIASNLGNTYVEQALRLANDVTSSERASEDRLEQIHHLLTEMEQFGFGNKTELRSLKFTTTKQLINYYFRGYKKEERKEIVEMLMNIDS